MKNIEQQLIKAAQNAGTLLRDNAFEFGKLEWKKLDDPVTSMDKEAEKEIRAVLTKEAPGNFIGEELGFENNSKDRTYIIDPIDGTKSFILRDFISSVSIGVEENKELVGGIVYDFMKDIMYIGYKGKAYIMNKGKKYGFRKNHALSKPRIECNNEKIRELLKAKDFSVSDSRGSIALSMAEVAAGNRDGMISAEIGKGNIWDVAAGYYMLKSQGFVVLDFEGKVFDYKKANRGLIVLKPEMASKVLHIINEYRRAIEI